MSVCPHKTWQDVPLNGRKCVDCGMWLEDYPETRPQPTAITWRTAVEIEVTQADRDAANLAFNVWDNTNELALAFARHRQAAIKERDAEIERLREKLTSLEDTATKAVSDLGTKLGRKEAELDAALADLAGATREVEGLRAALYQYRSDLLYPPAQDSRERRIAMIDALLAGETNRG